MDKLLKVLMVEDSEDDMTLILRELRRGGYAVALQRVETLVEMTRALQHEQWDIIISDYNLPGFSGRAALDYYKHLGLDIPFIVVSGAIGEDTAVEMMRAGAHDYLLKGKLARLVAAVDRELREAELRREGRQAEKDLRASEDRFRSLVQNSTDIINVIDPSGFVLYESPSAAKILGYESGYWMGKNPFTQVHPDDAPAVNVVMKQLISGKDIPEPVQYRFRTASGEWIYLESVGINLLDQPQINGIVLTTRDVTRRKSDEEELRSLNQQLQESYDETLNGWANALELREKETAVHSRHVVALSLKVAQVMGFSGEELVHLRRGALLHDIGKMGIPDSILLKPGPLTPQEWEVMREHPNYAYRFLSGIPYLRAALDVPYCHHEKWDGSGYPRQLKGEEIPLSARIFAVVDVWDALSSERPYRGAWSVERVIEYLREQSGKQFDPQVVEVFLKIIPNND
jgi:PAS domain S-box-containing protein